MRKNTSRFREGRTAIKQDEIIETLKKTSLAAKDFLKIGIDTVAINDEMEDLVSLGNIAGDGVFSNTSTIQTHRNLSTTTAILQELDNRAISRKNQVDRYYKSLSGYRNILDSLHSDSSLYEFKSDSASTAQYLQKVILLSQETMPVDSSLQRALSNAVDLQSRVNRIANWLESSIERVDQLQRDLTARNFRREFPNLWKKQKDEKSFSEIIKFSKIKGELALGFYAFNNLGKIFFVLVLIVVATIFLLTLKKRLVEDGLLEPGHTIHLAIRYPFLSAVVIILSIFQFIFPNPPFSFSVVIWIICSVALTIMFRRSTSSFWFRGWLLVFLMFLLASADNLILQPSLAERWGLLVLGLAGGVGGIIAMARGPWREINERWIFYFATLVIVLELSAVIAILYGRYNLAKTFVTSGFFNLIIAIMFLWTMRLINEGLGVAFEVYKAPDKSLFYINFQRVGNKIPRIFYILPVIGWFILFGRNFYAFRAISDPIKNFLFQERTIGDYTFSIKGLLIFFLILIIATLLSKLVSFFASDKPGEPSKPGARPVLGSYILLIRIAIISIGLFLAFAAAGIPMDKVTIIIGALGVGIGFGLQTLVNNLVSGLILSFEKPVNVGDMVDVGKQSGTMKSIGFRSSVIANWDGADVVIPNGDLLSQHLVNWTTGRGLRRSSIVVRVAYGTELAKVKQLLMDILHAEERVVKYPAPGVYVIEFNSSAIDLQLFFWVPGLELTGIKSDVIVTIDKVFRENNIEIPLPQQEIRILEEPGTTEEKDSV